MPLISNIAVAQAACTRIGIPPVTSFEGEEAAPVYLATNYEQTVEAEMTGYEWRFCMVEQILSRQAAEPLGKRWDAIYELPPDLLQLLTVIQSERPINYDRYSNTVYCNADADNPVIAEYVTRKPEVEWPGAFTELMIRLLSAGLANAVQERGDVAKTWLDKATDQRIIAMGSDSRQQTTKKIHLKRFQANRRTHTRGDYSRADRWR